MNEALSTVQSVGIATREGKTGISIGLSMASIKASLRAANPTMKGLELQLAARREYKVAASKLGAYAGAVVADLTANGFVCGKVSKTESKNAHRCTVVYVRAKDKLAKLGKSDISLVKRLEAGGFTLEQIQGFLSSDAQKVGKAADLQAIKDVYDSVHIKKDSEK